MYCFLRKKNMVASRSGF